MQQHQCGCLTHSTSKWRRFLPAATCCVGLIGPVEGIQNSVVCLSLRCFLCWPGSDQKMVEAKGIHIFIYLFVTLFLKVEQIKLLACSLNHFLSLQDEVLTVIRRVDENWAEGMLGDKIGIFPILYVEVNTHTHPTLTCQVIAEGAVNVMLQDTCINLFFYRASPFGDGMQKIFSASRLYRVHCHEK